MSHPEKQSAIVQGKSDLKSGIFPNEVLEQFSEPRLRREIYKGIFFLTPEEQQNQTEEEKKFRAKLLKVQSAFGSYERAFKNTKGISYVLLVASLVVILTAQLGLNNNMVFGLLSVIGGLGILVFDIKKKLLAKYSLFLAVGFLLFFAFEILLFNIPEPFIYDMDQDVLASRRGALVKIANAVSPVAYLALKGSVAFVLVTVHMRIAKFHKLKAEFEGK